MSKRIRIVGAVASVLLVVGPASANAGLPMISFVLPKMLMALAPIILLEAYILMRGAGVSFGRATWAMGAGNVLSTLVGLPLACGAWLLLPWLIDGDAYNLATPLKKIIAVTWQAGWLLPYEEDLHWMVPAATLTLLVPFFFASWLLEYLVARMILGDVDRGLLRRTVRNANLTSYAILAAIVGAWWIYGAIEAAARLG